MSYEIDAMHQQLQEFELMAAEYVRLERLIDYAAQGQDMARYGGQSILSVDPLTLRVIDTTPAALELLGYSKDELLRISIPKLQVASAPARTYVETSIEEQVYEAVYRHRLGHQLRVKVYKRLLSHNVLQYRLEDESLQRRLWYELQRREDDGFKFQQKLRILNEITIELSRIEPFDALCLHAVEAGVERLGFDRIGMWFLDAERSEMVGSYGIDEQGTLRAEHEQRWSYDGTYIMDFIGGKTEAALAHDDAPIYNEKSEIIESGWHISAPMLHADRCIGILTSDNYLRKQPMKNYEPELLRLYGITVGHLIELARARAQTFAIRLEQERTHMLRQFIANVGHDFKTPLSVINTNNYLIQRAQGAEQKQSLAAGIHQQVTYISHMLDRMLEFIALESDLTLERVATDLKQLLTEVIAASQSASAGKNIHYELAFEGELSIPADPHYLQRALREILDNAIQYTLAGGWVRVSSAQHADEIEIRVQDSGIGIGKNALDKVFTPLYRIDEARTERRNGLGLAIARTIVQAHHGRIEVDSVPGEGSTFEIILPRVP